MNEPSVSVKNLTKSFSVNMSAFLAKKSSPDAIYRKNILCIIYSSTEDILC